MAQFQVTSPEGKQFRVTAPDGASKDDVLAYAQKQFAQPAAAPTDAEGGVAAALAPTTEHAPPGTDLADLAAGSLPGRFLLGAASLPIGAAQLKEHIYGNPGPIDRYIQQLDEMKARGRAAVGNEGFDWAGLAGGATTPVGVAGKALEGATLLGKIGKGAVTGAGIGAATPVVDTEGYTGKKALQVGVGAAAGGALPAVAAPVVGVGKAIYNLVEPYLPGGVEKIAGRTANSLAGDRAGAVVDALQAQRQIVPGSAPTAADAATPVGSAEFSALGKIAAQRDPSAYNAIDEAQQGARAGAINQIAGGATNAEQAATLAEAVATRKAATDPLYKAAQASKSAVDTQPVMDYIRGVLKNNPNEDAVRRPLADISSKLRVEDLPAALNSITKTPVGAPIPQLESDPKSLISLSKDIRNKIEAKNPDGSPAYDVAVLTQIKQKLDAQIEKAVTPYAEARGAFRELSGPVNQLQVGAELSNRLTRATGAEAPGTFLSAVDDAAKTLKAATGFRAGSIDKVLEPEQMDAVNRVVTELERKTQTNKLAGLGMPAAREALATNLAPVQIPGLLDRGVMITRAVLDRLQGKAGTAALDMLTEKMKDPNSMAQLMQNATPGEKEAIIKALMNRRVPLIPAAASTLSSQTIGGSAYSGGH